jgi:hypothetical protein
VCRYVSKARFIINTYIHLLICCMSFSDLCHTLITVRMQLYTIGRLPLTPW